MFTLQAINKKTHRLVWDFPINRHLSHCEKTELGLTLIYENDPATLYLHDIETGELKSKTPIKKMPLTPNFIKNYKCEDGSKIFFEDKVDKPPYLASLHTIDT